jgi:superfamily II DNA or RNA helicase
VILVVVVVDVVVDVVVRMKWRERKKKGYGGGVMMSTRERESKGVFFLQFCDGREERKRGSVREERHKREREKERSKCIAANCFHKPAIIKPANCFHKPGNIAC